MITATSNFGSSQSSSVKATSRSNSISNDSTFSSLDIETASSRSFVPLLEDKTRKTLDIGSRGNTVSASPLGTILQLSTYHPVHGIIVASPHPQFDGSRFTDPQYVRSYRSLMLDDIELGRHGFGIRLDAEPRNVEIGFQDNSAIQINFDAAGVSVEQHMAVDLDGNVYQTLLLASRSDAALPYVFELGISVNRASYGQLTEGGPLPIPESKNILELAEGGGGFTVLNPNLDARVDGILVVDDKPIDLTSQLQACSSHRKAIAASYSGSVRVSPGKPVSMTAIFRLSPSAKSAGITPQTPPCPVQFRGQWKIGNDEEGMIIKRNLEYILRNCTVPIGGGTVCFITDHVALPLGWNRDNYYQVRFLLDVHKHLADLTYPETAQVYSGMIKEATRGHLSWVYRAARRPLGYWHRSYLANGVPKDGPVFQFDQQCYPLLEICDFLDTFPKEREFVRELIEEDTIPEVLKTLNAHRDARTGLYMTDETPGDDAVEYPFHFSSHILLWYTLSRLSHTLKGLGRSSNLNSHTLEQMASMIKDATFRHFVCNGKFAYLTDGQSNRTFYHDANDIPTLFARDWGFVESASELSIWANTMDFGLSPENKEGFFPEGRFQGLGSVHTRAPWPLGYAQELIYAELRGDAVARESAWTRIKGTMFWDGLFAEAVDGRTGRCVSKAWFSWPGSVIGSAILNKDRRAKLDVLSVKDRR